MSKPKSKTQPPKTADMYRALFEAAGEAMFVLNNGVISRCNPGALALFGGDAKTLEGRPFESLSPPTRPDGSNPADELKSRQTTALSGVGQRFEWLFRRQNGQTFLAEVGLHGFESDGQQLVLASVRDITQSEDAQAIRALLSKRVQEQAALNEISRAVFEQTDPQAVYELVTQSLVDRFNMSFARIWILDETTNELVLRVSKGEYTHLDGPHSRVPLTSSRKLAWIAGRRAPHITNDLLNDTRVDDKSWVKTSKTVAFAGYPLIAGDDLLGVLGMFSHHPIAEETLAVVQALAVLTGTVVNNRRLFKNMEAALEEANLLRRAVEQSPDGSAVASMEGHILFANRA
ncbi:MAG: PAS domain S-box protein, partial [Anaerolineae bacterium]